MPYRRQLAAALRGDTLTLSIVRDTAGKEVAFDPHAAMVDRVLAAAASGVMDPARVETTIRDTPELRQQVIGLAGAQMGDVSLGQVAGRDIVTIHVHVGADPK